MLKKIPSSVLEVLQTIENAGFEAFVVGGCVRDMLMDIEPNDWDITTKAKPEKITELFPDSFYENNFGTVGVKVQPFAQKNNAREHDIVEVTTYRTESKYSDRRRPDEINFAEKLEDDLGRRDFTMNAVALRVKSATDYEIVDLFNGLKDIQEKTIRTVGDPSERFSEDALRMIRAIRFHSQLGFEIEKETLLSIQKHSNLLVHVSMERIRDEFCKIILSKKPMEGIDMLQKSGLLQYFIPELEKGIGVDQNKHHTYTIYKHSLLALEKCPSKKLEVRLASLFHDIAKPQTKRGFGSESTFYNHDHVGAKMTQKILERLKFSNDIIKKVVLLVDNHMFYYNPEEVGESSVRKLIRKVGLENIKDLMDVRIADRLGSGTPKAKPYKLRHLEYMIDKVSKDAVSVKMLKINGNDLIKNLSLKPSPVIGAILDVLLAEVIEDSAKNTYDQLLSRAEQLKNNDLSSLRNLAKEKIEEKKEDDDKEIKNKHWVK